MNRYRKFTVTETLQALTVEVIRRLWDRGLYQSNRLARAVHDNWIGIWIDWRTQITMRHVDNQASEILQQWEASDVDPIDRFAFSEEATGETPLGGEMRLRATFMDEDAET